MAAPGTGLEWGRRRLLVLLALVAAGAVLLAGGLAYAVWAALAPSAGSGVGGGGSAEQAWPAGSDGVRGPGYRDAVAAEPMLPTGPEDLEPAAPALDEPDPFLIGPPTGTGPGGVPTGFEHTPDGAVAQLAALEVAALTPMSLGHARDLHDRWALPGARFDRWGIAEAIQSFHTAAGTSDGDATVRLSATPVGGQVKGTDGPDWVLACAQLDVTVMVVERARFGYGHCERMHWQAGRWMIAPGEPPAPAPSTWPGSQRSLDAGWRLWVDRDPG
jgi:hypothetical protein